MIGRLLVAVGVSAACSVASVFGKDWAERKIKERDDKKRGRRTIVAEIEDAPEGEDNNEK